MAKSHDILVEQNETGTVIVTLNRAAKRNAISFDMWRRLGELFSDFAKRDDVRIVVLTGAGGHFSAGADISEFPAMRSSPEAAREYNEAGHRATLAIRDLPQPTIAAASGYCVGGGCGIALACDLRVADITTQMGIPAARRGIVYSVLDTELLIRTVGLPRAKLVLYSGDIFPLARCREMGLVDVVSEQGALAGALALARDLSQRAPLSQRGSKLTLEAIARNETAARHAEIEAAQARAAASEDYREATASFMDKRAPVFRGR
ncbi:MAG TPA: enoyl-CoA hydratase-related protein [Acetobacteraceae bacterium]|nr:enoyl-CoA hydratase-related protein [Acetobacteraceae bacterium]